MIHDSDLTPEEKLISRKAIYHKYCEVHLTFTNGNWENGKIIDVGSNFLILEFKNIEGINRWGSRQKEFFFLEISDIEKYEEGGKI